MHEENSNKLNNNSIQNDFKQSKLKLNHDNSISVFQEYNEFCGSPYHNPESSSANINTLKKFGEHLQSLTSNKSNILSKQIVSEPSQTSIGKDIFTAISPALTKPIKRSKVFNQHHNVKSQQGGFKLPLQYNILQQNSLFDVPYDISNQKQLQQINSKIDSCLQTNQNEYNFDFQQHNLQDNDDIYGWGGSDQGSPKNLERYSMAMKQPLKLKKIKTCKSNPQMKSFSEFTNNECQTNNSELSSQMLAYPYGMNSSHLKNNQDRQCSCKSPNQKQVCQPFKIKQQYLKFQNNQQYLFKEKHDFLVQNNKNSNKKLDDTNNAQTQNNNFSMQTSEDYNVSKSNNNLCNSFPHNTVSQNQQKNIKTSEMQQKLQEQTSFKVIQRAIKYQNVKFIQKCKRQEQNKEENSTGEKKNNSKFMTLDALQKIVEMDQKYKMKLLRKIDPDQIMVKVKQGISNNDKGYNKQSFFPTIKPNRYKKQYISDRVSSILKNERLRTQSFKLETEFPINNIILVKQVIKDKMQNKKNIINSIPNSLKRNRSENIFQLSSQISLQTRFNLNYNSENNNYYFNNQFQKGQK